MGLALAGCQGGGGSESGSSNDGGADSAQSSNNQNDSQSSQSNQGGGSQTGEHAVLTWDAPAERENGDTLKVGSIDQYVVSWGKDPDNLANSTTVSCESCVDMEYVVEDLGDGTWYFTVQTEDTSGNVSRKADLASKQI
ncbi:MAG: fibronectin type III domain-containing protein [Pseudomonadota bacterium]